MKQKSTERKLTSRVICIDRVGFFIVQERVVPQTSLHNACAFQRRLELERTGGRADVVCLHVVVDVS